MDGLLDWIDWFVEGRDWIELGRLDWIGLIGWAGFEKPEVLLSNQLDNILKSSAFKL